MSFLFSHIRLKVLSGSKPPSWSSLSFHLLRTQSSHLLMSFSKRPLRVRASIMIFAKFLSSSGFRVSVFSLRQPVLWFPILLLHRVCLLKSSQSQSLYHDLCSDSVENKISGFRLRLQFMIRFPGAINGFGHCDHFPYLTTLLKNEFGSSATLGSRHQVRLSRPKAS